VRHSLAAILLVVAVGACASPDRKEAVPASMTERATVLGGLPNARYFADTQSGEIIKEAYAALARERAHLNLAPNAPLPPANFLAISGGGDNGAYGAGLLCAWTERGDRPEFKLVTGVSTGSLIAPFAFLGSSYDNVLRKVYTEVNQKDIFESRALLTAIFDDALTDTTPLFGLISQYVDDNMLAAVAAEYKKGRLLLIGTTDIDAQRPVIWNIGAIAASG
jgi:predicted acylesterase/phospholipase RssA